MDSQDVCRVCRTEGEIDRPLYHPCLCTGTIRYVHQECLVQWLKYSKKQFCELCNYDFSFIPIYSPDMPRRLPFTLVISGVLSRLVVTLKTCFHYFFVILAWIGAVPFIAWRVYAILFSDSFTSILDVPLRLILSENPWRDIIRGAVIEGLTLFVFISLVWLRDQIVQGGGPDWLDVEALNGIMGHQRPPVADEAVEDEAVEQEQLPAPAPNAMDWDGMEAAVAGGEELTWERLLGLDGSIVFLEHVFWVVSLNTLFIFVFVFCPYHIGRIFLSFFTGFYSISGFQYEGPINGFIGYVMFAMCFFIMHKVANRFLMNRFATALGVCYLFIKVGILLVAEIFVFPIFCGIWLNVCSLTLFNANLKDRIESFNMSPAGCLFIHWLLGMIYVFYFASFVIILREVLRPGVLWFLRNINDPNFNPIQEMIVLSGLHHVRQYLASMAMFGISILVTVYLPAQTIKRMIPSFLPYYTSNRKDTRMDEFYLEIFFLLIIMPTIQDQTNAKDFLKMLIRYWCRFVGGYTLGLHSYLLGQLDENTQESSINHHDIAAEEVDRRPIQEGFVQEGIGAIHEAMFRRNELPLVKPYIKPRFFVTRLFFLVICFIFSLLFTSIVCLVMPVFLGRNLLKFYFYENAVFVYELYPTAIGVYFCLQLLRFSMAFVVWIRSGWTQIASYFKKWARVTLKIIIACFMVLGVMPLMLGVLLDVTMLMPIRVGIHQTPIVYLWHDWSLGLMYTKMIITLTMFGPNWWLKETLEHLYRQGYQRLCLKYLLSQLVLPVSTVMMLALAIPYILGHSILPSLIFFLTKESDRTILGISNDVILHVCHRFMYPLLPSVIFCIFIIIFQIKQFKALYKRIKNDRYLVGQKLVNYSPEPNITNSDV